MGLIGRKKTSTSAGNRVPVINPAIRSTLTELSRTHNLKIFTIKRMTSSGILRRVALVRTDV
jgi:hypothetical protein